MVTKEERKVSGKLQKKKELENLGKESTKALLAETASLRAQSSLIHRSLFICLLLFSVPRARGKEHFLK